MKRVIHGIFYLRSGTKIEEIRSFNEEEENEAAEIVSKIADITEAFRRAKKEKLLGTIQFNYTIADIGEIAALKFYDEVVVVDEVVDE